MLSLGCDLDLPPMRVRLFLVVVVATIYIGTVGTVVGGLGGRAAALAGQCRSATSVSITLSWAVSGRPAPSEVDMFMVGLYVPGDPPEQPSMILTATTLNATVEDLAPGRAYQFRVKAHPHHAHSRVSGWGTWSVPWECATQPRPPGAAARVWSPGPLRPTAVTLRWRWEPPNCTDVSPTALLTVRWRWTADPLTTAGASAGGSVRPPLGRALAGATTVDRRQTTVTLRGLQPGAAYRVTVGTADPLVVWTAAPGLVHTEVFRVSEGTDQIDLLENHNSGDLLGETAFLTDSSNFGVPANILATDPCARALNSTGCLPGGGDSCLSCVHAAWERSGHLRQQCSDPAVPWPRDNKVVEAWCNTSFAFFDWQVRQPTPTPTP